MPESSDNLSLTTDAEANEPISWTKAALIVRNVRWRWKGWLPAGMATMISSDPGEGKSAIALRIAQCYSTGENWPDDTPFEGETGKVLWCESEAAQAINLQRAKAWGVDTDQLIYPFNDPFVDISFEDTKHTERIKKMLSRPDVRLMVLDSLSGSHTKDEKSSQAGQISKICAQLARDTDKEVLIIHHLRKQGADLPTNNRRVVELRDVRGSSTIVQPMRVIMAIDRPTGIYRRLRVIKSNAGVFPDPIGFEMYEEAALEFFQVVENEEVQTQKVHAISILKQLLKNGPVRQSVIAEKMSNENISRETANRAKKELEVISRKIGKYWYWLFVEHDHLDYLDKLE